MKIKKSDLKALVRKSIINEITDSFGDTRLHALEFNCPWEEAIPNQLKGFFKKAGGNVEDNLAEVYPSLKLGTKMSKDASLITSLLGELGYVMNTAFAAGGAPCFMFYVVNQALELISTILGLINETEEAEKIKSTAEKLAPKIDFYSAISKAASSSGKSKDAGMFKNDFPFYVFPRLTGTSSFSLFEFKNKSVYNIMYESSNDSFEANEENISKLRDDIEAYTEMISNVRNVRTESVSRAIKELSSIMKISDYVDFKVPDTDKSQESVAQLKGAAQVALNRAFSEASKSYQNIPEYNTLMVNFAHNVV